MNSYFIPTSDLFYCQACNLIYSIQKYDVDSHIYLGDLGLSNEHIEECENNDFHVLKMPEEYKEKIKPTRWPKEYLMKYVLPWLLPEDVDKILCLGADMLIINDITPLFSIKMNDKALAAAVEMSGNLADIRSPIFCKLPCDRLYLNAELLLMNLSYFRSNYSAEKIIKAFADMQDELKFFDQDFINVFFYGKMIPLSPKYNCQIRELSKTEEARIGLKNAGIVHYSAANKPWYYKCKPKWIKHYIEHSSPEYGRSLNTTLIKSYLYRATRIPYFWRLKRLIMRKRIS